ncbi:hypothetical protein JG688_00017522 [Phytophthora aleatoria]|uniref:Uncharacterized protein n=1 Tax=Phytophthora aleatoria TaxID=2496075 RepID=A0A8J5LVA3_9STRA|nr:hypothetical protein JG688_00017522 [Phytophthora aleatoria]
MNGASDVQPSGPPGQATSFPNPPDSPQQLTADMARRGRRHGYQNCSTNEQMLLFSIVDKVKP